MCEANVYLVRDGVEELLMEKVDRVVPGADDTVMLESVFGERRILKARIRELELVRHRIVLDEVRPQVDADDAELWLVPDTGHGHFHPGEEVSLTLWKGKGMRPGPGLAAERVEAFVVRGGQQVAVGLQSEGQGLRLSLGQGEDGLVTVYAREEGDRRCYAKVIIEVGHHHHQGVEPVGLPLEIVPRTHRHVHLGDHYEFTVLKHGRPLAGATVRATYPGSRSAGYPVRVATDESGSARVFLTAPGNWLFSVTDGDVTSTFTLVKGF